MALNDKIESRSYFEQEKCFIISESGIAERNPETKYKKK